MQLYEQVDEDSSLGAQRAQRPLVGDASERGCKGEDKTRENAAVLGAVQCTKNIIVGWGSAGG